MQKRSARKLCTCSLLNHHKHFFLEPVSTTFYFGGTSLLIVVSVALDTIQQIEGYLYEANYATLGSTDGAVQKIRESEAI